MYENGGRGCRVDGVLYEHGAGAIAPSFDCGGCICDDGDLRCPELACNNHCPEGGVRGVGCAVCGNDDACLATEIGCFPPCTRSEECSGSLGACVRGACVTDLCG